ncbi:MAG: hypothetical protein IPG87_03055 [Saprospiraceae bacterium]|nr:hypothetical protein [Candidatus Vicinibacter affinis]
MSNKIFAQDTLRIRTFLKKSKQKKQKYENGSDGTSNIPTNGAAESIAKAVDPYVMVIETRYQITKDGKFYGNNFMKC